MDIKAAVFTLGCKVNQYESAAIVSELNNLGFNAFEGLKQAELYVINTCSVTAEADKKSRQAVARVLKYNPAAKVIIVGCSSQNSAKNFMDKPQVTAVFGTAGKIKNIAETAKELLAKLNSSKIDKELNIDKEFKDDKEFKKLKAGFFRQQNIPLIYEDDFFPTLSKTRAYIKIQDGCDCFCSYCRVPYLRGRSRSRETDSILDESRRLGADVKEIVLTGIDISAYGKDLKFFGGDKVSGGDNEADLRINGAVFNVTVGNTDSKTSLTALIKLLRSGVRKRLGSLECRVIDEDLLKAMADSGFCDHFHLSLQSGSDTVLRRMNRHYATAEFLHKTELIRKHFPYAGITTDVIAGFPQETSAEHEETKRFIKQAEFSDIHVFPYSPRKGTVAYKFPQLDKSIREERAAEISKIKDELKQAFLTKNLGRICEVYAEESENGYVTGFTSNYIKVYTCLMPNELKPQRLTKTFKQGVLGVNE